MDGQKIVLNDLIQATTSNSLFAESRTVVIENLFSRLKSKEQDTILTWLKDYSGDAHLILWEKKSIGKVLQRNLPLKITVKEFKPPMLVFKLVEALTPTEKPAALKLLAEVLATEAPEFLFTMIVRQVRLMILIQGGETIAGAPWMVGKLKKQASAFEPENLLNAYNSLYNIDKQIKTGVTVMPLAWHLEMWISNL